MQFCRIKIDSFDIEKILSKDELSKFVKMHFKKGEICYPNDEIKLLFFKEGEAKVSFLHEDKETIYMMHPGSVIEFLSDSVVLSINVKKYSDIFNNHMFCNIVLNSFTKIMMLEKTLLKDLFLTTAKEG